jgi:ribonuclease D
MHFTFTYITTPEQLQEACTIWQKEQELAIDLECENNLHHYGVYIALIQISTKKHHWIIDVLQLQKIDSLLKILKNPRITKIFHDISFDLRIIHYQYRCQPKKIFDTQVAALLLGKEEIGLGALLENYFEIKKERRFQMADWTKRPLNKDMLAYATKDTAYLIQLKALLKNELQKLDRLPWFIEEMCIIEERVWEYQQGSYKDIRGFSTLSEKERSVAKHLFLLREKLAKKVDRPVHFVLNNKKLMEYAQHPPEWKVVRGVHPIVRNKAHLFYEAVREGKKHKIVLPKKQYKRFTQQQKNYLEKLDQLRQTLAEKLHIKRHLLLNKEQMQQIVITRKTDNLRQWQLKLLSPLPGW